MFQHSSDRPPGHHSKSKGNYTGERLKQLRPETYRRVVQLLAEPREHVSYREICRRCHVTDDTIKAIERRESVPIAARKQELMVQAARIAKRAADRVEDEIDNAPLPQAVVTFGVMTDKISLLSNDPQLIQVNVSGTIKQDHQAPSIFERLNEMACLINERNRPAQLNEPTALDAATIAAQVERPGAQPALPGGETALDSGAEAGSKPEEQTR